MPTRKIPLLDNEYYHIYNRGYQKHILFHDEDDFKRFYETVIRYNKDFISVKIYAYCLLPNHFHFIVSSKSGLDISDFMRKIQQGYTMYYRAKYKESSPDSYCLCGPLFEGRFRAKHIDSEEYLAQCLAYVSYNPVKHEIVDDIEEYPWTSLHQLSPDSKIHRYKEMLLTELEY